jgi:hypothetical protein
MPEPRALSAVRSAASDITGFASKAYSTVGVTLIRLSWLLRLVYV